MSSSATLRTQHTLCIPSLWAIKHGLYSMCLKLRVLSLIARASVTISNGFPSKTYPNSGGSGSIKFQAEFLYFLLQLAVSTAATVAKKGGLCHVGAEFVAVQRRGGGTVSTSTGKEMDIVVTLTGRCSSLRSVMMSTPTLRTYLRACGVDSVVSGSLATSCRVVSALSYHRTFQHLYG